MAVSIVHLHSPVELLVVGQALGITGTATVRDTARMMRRHNVSAILVDGGAAIVTERDLTAALRAGLGPEDPVSGVPTTAPVTVPGDMAILEATALMLNEGVRHLVVDLGAESRGILSMRALTAALLQAAQPEPWLVGLRRAGLMSRSEIWLG